MSGTQERRWPSSVYGCGDEPDPRVSLANERTFLAWIRTALGFLAVGVALVAVARFGSALRVETRIASIGLIGCGLACAASAYVRWARTERALRLGRPLPAAPMMPVVSGLLVLIAVGAVILVSLG